jgi:hypothetical protein
MLSGVFVGPLTTPLFSNFLFTNLFSIKFLYFFIISSLFFLFKLVRVNIQTILSNSPTGARGTDLPPPLFLNFLFTNLFSIKFLDFFIISSLFPYFNLFMSIFIQSYVNIKLHVSTLLDTNNTQTLTRHATR